MEKSNEKLLTGIAKLERQNPFPDEIFYRIFEIEDNVERQKYIEALRNEAKILKRSTEFNNLLKQFQLDYIQRMRQTGNKTAFTDQPLELICAEWSATDMGVKTIRYDKNMQDSGDCLQSSDHADRNFEKRGYIGGADHAGLF